MDGPFCGEGGGARKVKFQMIAEKNTFFTNFNKEKRRAYGVVDG